MTEPRNPLLVLLWLRSFLPRREVRLSLRNILHSLHGHVGAQMLAEWMIAGRSLAAQKKSWVMDNTVRSCPDSGFVLVLILLGDLGRPWSSHSWFPDLGSTRILIFKVWVGSRGSIVLTSSPMDSEAWLTQTLRHSCCFFRRQGKSRITKNYVGCLLFVDYFLLQRCFYFFYLEIGVSTFFNGFALLMLPPP